MKSKLIVLIVIITIASKAIAQLPIDDETGKVVFTDVVELDGMTKDEIYQKAKYWVITTLKSGDNMVELDGTNSDQIIGTGNISLPDESISFCSNVVLNFKFIVKCKDNRLKYNIENFNLSCILSNNSLHSTGIENITPPKQFYNKNKPKFITEVKMSVNISIGQLVNNFKASMTKKDEDDW